MEENDDNTPGLDHATSKEWIYPTNYAVRDYQKNIVSKALFQNTLVSLPTGLGKTFIAAVVMFNFHRWYPHHKIIFMAHSKPLVAQQVDACCHIMGIPKSVTAELNGNISSNMRKQHWERKQIFFLTPQVFNNDLTRGLVPAESIRCVVIDEAHKALGNQAFCQSIRALQPFNKTFRVLALSATPGDDIPMVKSVIENLLISHLELRTEEDSDIKKYLHEKKVEAVVVSLDSKIIEYKTQLLKISEKYLQQLVQMKAVNANFASLSSFSLVLKQKQFIGNPSVGPDQRGFVLSNFSLVISIYKALEELVVHGLRSFHNKLITMKTGEGSTNNVHHRFNKDLDFLKLIDDIEKYIGQDKDIAFDPNVSMAKLQNDLDTHVEGTKKPIVYSHPKFVILEQIIVEHFEEWKKKEESTRVIVFCKSRPCTGEICNFLNRFTPLIKPMVLIGQSQASGGSTSRGLKQSAQLEVMRKFREGAYNTLVATCVGEEGLDVGEVDLIVNFDATRNSNTQVQRSGRTGRKRDGRVVNLLTEGKEYQDYNVAVSKTKNITKKLSNGIKNLPLYPNSPRLLPDGFHPICQEMYLKPTADIEQQQQKKLDNVGSKTKRKNDVDIEQMEQKKPDNIVSRTKNKNDEVSKIKNKRDDVSKSKAKKPVPKKQKKCDLLASQNAKYDIRYAMSRAEEKFKSQWHHDDTSDSLFESVGAVEMYKNVNKSLKSKQECLSSPMRDVEVICLEDSMDFLPDIIDNDQINNENSKIPKPKASLVNNISLNSLNFELCDEIDKLDINDLLNLVSNNKDGIKMPEKYLNYDFLAPFLMPNKEQEEDEYNFDFIEIPLSDVQKDLPPSFPEWSSSPFLEEKVDTPIKICVETHPKNNCLNNEVAFSSTPKPNVSMVTVTQAISMIASMQKKQKEVVADDDKSNRTPINISQFPSNFDLSVCENGKKEQEIINSNKTSPVLKFTKQRKHASRDYSLSNQKEDEVQNSIKKETKILASDWTKNGVSINFSQFSSNFDFSACEGIKKNQAAIISSEKSPVSKLSKQTAPASDFSFSKLIHLEDELQNINICNHSDIKQTKPKNNAISNGISEFPSKFDFSICDSFSKERNQSSPVLKVSKNPNHTSLHYSKIYEKEDDLQIVKSPEAVERLFRQSKHIPVKVTYEKVDEEGSPSMVSFSTYNNRENSKVKKSLNFDNESQIFDTKPSQSSLGFLNLDSDDDIFANDEKELEVILTQREATSHFPMNSIKEVTKKPMWPPSTHKNTPKTAIVRPMGFENKSSSIGDSEWLCANPKSKESSHISFARKKATNKKVDKSQKSLDSFFVCHSVETPARVPSLHNYHQSLDDHSSTFDCMPEDLAIFFDDTTFSNKPQTSTPLQLKSVTGKKIINGKLRRNNSLATTPLHTSSVSKNNQSESSAMPVSNQNKHNCSEISIDDDLSDGALEALKAVEDFEKNCKPAETSVNRSTQSDPAVFNLWSSDDSEDLFEKSKSKTNSSKTTTPSIQKRKKSSNVCIGRKKKNPFVEDEAGISDGSSRASSDEENTSGLDDLDSSFLDERIAPTQAPDVDMTAKYLATVRSPRLVVGGFKIPDRIRPNINVFSQVVHDDEDYEHDSFCVPEDSEVVDDELSYLELAELALKNKKKRRRKTSPELNSHNKKKKKRRRIITADSSSDGETESKENLKSPITLKSTTPGPYNKYCAAEPRGIVVNKSSVLLSNKVQTKCDTNIQKLVFIGSRQIASAPEITIALRAKFNFKVEVRSCPGADFIVGWRLGINRITLSDFCNGSPTIKASFRESMLKLTELFLKPILIVEDDKNKGVSRTVGCHKDMWMKHSAKRLTRLYQSGIATLFSRNKDETAQFIANLTEDECAKGHGIIIDKEMSPELEVTLKFYTSLPGINIALALRFCRKFSTLSCFLSSCDSVDILVRELGIPKSTAINVYQALHLSLNS